MEQCFPKIPRATVVLLFIFFLTFTLLVSFSRCVDPTYIYNFCSNSTLYPSNRKYQSNLNTLLSSLSSLASSYSNNSYHNATAGNIPNAVFGHYYCRGDVTHDICHDCVNFAAKDIVNRCPKAQFGTIWYDECTLRYSNHSFFSVLFESATFGLSNVKSISDPTQFKQLLIDTANEVATEAALNSNRFATEEATFTKFQNLYCLAQCSPDLSVSDCNKCLVDAISYLPSDKQGGRTFNPSCNIRFEVYPFYRVSAVAPAPSPTTVVSPPPRNKLAPSVGLVSPPPNNLPPFELTPLFDLVSSPPPSSITTIPEKQESSTRKIVAIVVPTAAAALILLYFFVFWKKTDLSKNNGGNPIKSADSLQFDFGMVIAATDNFSDENKIGEGGFGAVYEGILPNGQKIAVKRLSRNLEQGPEEFKNEVLVVAKLQHHNLVRLLGFCLEGEEKILIYEFVPDKNLDYFLVDPKKCARLDWEGRFKIIEGIARGCLYLHEDSCHGIIHGDLKASNILLDEEMNPKILVFGMARVFGVDKTQANTNRMVGTSGYMSPEYALHGFFSAKSDVFSFGVLVLEIISGKKISSFSPRDSGGDLVSYAWRLWEAGTTFELIDPIMRGNCSKTEVMRCIHIGLLCIQENAAGRPTMANIIHVLGSDSVTLPSPLVPTSVIH